MHISLSPEILFHIGDFSVTNTLMVSVLITFLLAVFAWRVRAQIADIPRGIQNFVEMVFESLLNFIDSVTEDRKDSVRFFPLVVTIFLFVLFSNFVELIPGLGTIGLVEATREGRVIIPFLRSSSADLNVTLAIALSSVIGIQVLGIASLGFFRYGKKFFFPPWEKPYFIGTFVGVLELVAEIAKVISFSFRLFGNIFAGEVLLLVMLFLVPVIAPLPFLFLEIFVGFIQAVVFSMLTLVFLKVATEHH